MAGIYVHIPFCRKACHYCNFHFSTSFNKKDELVDALVRELELRTDYPGDEHIKTIYFGGGTPSALPTTDIDRLMKTIRERYAVAGDAEVTLEANPEDITDQSVSAWKESGINRLSIGVQGFQDEQLKSWNRNHDALRAKESIIIAQKGGITNISADLIYGGPMLSDEEWERNILTLIELKVQHLSAYALTVEEGTVLAHQVKKGINKMPEDEQSSRQFEILQRITAEHHYVQYEVSNFALAGYESKHNTSYWKGIPYLGIGPSAHSFNGISRQWNVAHNIKYTHALRNDIIPFEIEILTPSQRYNEIVMTGLRTKRGIDMKAIHQLGSQFAGRLEQSIDKYIDEGKVEINTEGNYALKPQYLFFADGIASDLFIVDTESK